MNIHIERTRPPSPLHQPTARTQTRIQVETRWGLNNLQNESRPKTYCGSNQSQDGLHVKTMLVAFACLLGISTKGFSESTKRRIKVRSKQLCYIIFCGYLVSDLIVHINKLKKGIHLEKRIFLKCFVFSATGELIRTACGIFFDFALFNYLISLQYQKRYPTTAFKYKVSATLNMVVAVFVLSICEVIFPPVRYSYWTAFLCLTNHLCNFIFLWKYEYIPKVYVIKKHLFIRVKQHTLYPKEDKNLSDSKFMETV